MTNDDTLHETNPGEISFTLASSWARITEPPVGEELRYLQATSLYSVLFMLTPDEHPVHAVPALIYLRGQRPFYGVDGSPSLKVWVYLPMRSTTTTTSSSNDHQPNNQPPTHPTNQPTSTITASLPGPSNASEMVSFDTQSQHLEFESQNRSCEQCEVFECQEGCDSI